MDYSAFKQTFLIELNPGHAPNTPGKCSPDGSLLEWQWNAQCADITAALLREHGYNVEIARAMDEKVSLTFPVQHANTLCNKWGKENVLFISLHCDAAKGEGWHKATGWSIWTTPGTTESDRLATCIYHGAEKVQPDRYLRKDMTDGDPDKEANFYVLRKTNCPAVLIENGFMNDRHDCEWLLTEESKHIAARTILAGLEEYLQLRMAET